MLSTTVHRYSTLSVWHLETSLPSAWQVTVWQTNCSLIGRWYCHGTTVSIEVVVSTGLMDRLNESPVMWVVHLMALLLKMLHHVRLIIRMKSLSSDH